MIKGNVITTQFNKDEMHGLKADLEREGYGFQIFDHFPDFHWIKKTNPDCLIARMADNKDAMLNLCNHIKNNAATRHIILILVEDQYVEKSEIQAFELGADDYLTRPLRYRALKQRILKLFTRKERNGDRPRLIRYGNLIINYESYSVFLGDKELNFPKKEFDLLCFLATHPHQVLTRDDILVNIWKNDSNVQPRTIDVHIRKIRDKIGNDFVITIKGVGYRFNMENAGTHEN